MIHGQMLTYDPATGNGIVSSEGTRYAFDIEHWKGDSAPRVGLVVEIHLKDGGLVEFSPTADVSSVVEGNIDKLRKGAFWTSARRIRTDLGWNLILCYIVFAIDIFAWPAVYSNFGLGQQSITIWNFSGFWEQTLLLLAIASVAVIPLRKYRRWWPSLLLPAGMSCWIGYKLAALNFAVNQLAADPTNGSAMEDFITKGMQSMEVNWSGFATFAFLSIATSSAATTKYFRLLKQGSAE